MRTTTKRSEPTIPTAGRGGYARKILASFATAAIVAVVAAGGATGGTRADAATPGDSPDNPILVGDPSEVPAGAVEDATSTYLTPGECDSTRSWVLRTDGSEPTSHLEYRWSIYNRTDEYRWSVYKRDLIPGSPTETHQEKEFYVLRGWDNDSEPPTLDNPAWKLNPGNHSGHPDPGANTPYNTSDDENGCASWFYYKWVTVTDVEGTDDTLSPWAWDSFTAWQLSEVPPADPDGQDGEDNVANLIQIGERYHGYTDWAWRSFTPWQTSTEAPGLPDGLDSEYYQVGEGGPSQGDPFVREIVDSTGTDATVTYYAWTDGLACEPTDPPTDPSDPSGPTGPFVPGGPSVKGVQGVQGVTVRPNESTQPNAPGAHRRDVPLSIDAGL